MGLDEIIVPLCGAFLMLCGNKLDKEKNMKKIIASESVNIGHPDKTCDVIADAFLDAALMQDKKAQMAVECAIKNNKLFIYGEATTTAKIDYEQIAQEVLTDIGYTDKFEFIKEVGQQSPDINQAVEKEELMANDQGIVFGYATNETKEFMPLPTILAHKLMKVYDDFRRRSENYFADAKSQVSVEYENDVPVKITDILISVSHKETIENSQIFADLTENVIKSVLEEYKAFDKGDINILINPSGKFTVWGSYGDSGCVGRKIVVDNYGGLGRVGGGCFSSKNAIKVDRSGAYYARFVAKNVVAHGLADRCELGLSYAIGKAEPVSKYIETFGTNKVEIGEIEKYIDDNFSFRVQNIVDELDLLRPIYKQTACYGHFGRDEFSWERII